MWFKNRQHLSDTTLTQAYLESRNGNPWSQSTTDHLKNCEDCAKKYARLTTLVHTIKLAEEPDLLARITLLASRITKWTNGCDIALNQLMSSIDSTWDVVLMGGT